MGSLFLSGHGRTVKESREDLIKMVEAEEEIGQPDKDRILKELREVV